MNVLILAPNDGQTWNAIKDSLVFMGHNVVHICTRKQKHLIQREIVHNDFDLIFTGKEDLSNIHFKAPLIVWNTDKRRNIYEYGQKVLNTWKRAAIIFTNSDNERIQNETGVLSVNFQQGLDKKTYYPIEQPKLFDVSFIGNVNTIIHKGRKELLFALHKLPYKFNHFKKTWNDEHNKAVGMSKINVSHHAFQDFTISQSVRDYKILGAKGFLLTQYSQELETHFEEGVECEFYRNEIELKEKIQYYVNNDEEREKIALQGYKKALEKHTYNQRLILLFELLYINGIIQRN